MRAAQHAVVGSEELVGRADEEVRTDLGDVDWCVRRQMDAVEHASARTACTAAVIAGRSGPGSEQVGRTGQGHQPGPLRELGLDVATVSSADSRSNSTHRTVAPRAPPPVTHRTDVAVVVEARHDDLVTRGPGLGESAGEV